MNRTIKFLEDLREAILEVDGLGCYALHNRCSLSVIVKKRGVRFHEFEALTLTGMNRKLGLPVRSKILDEIVRENDIASSVVDPSNPEKAASISNSDKNRLARKEHMLRWIDDKICELTDEKAKS